MKEITVNSMTFEDLKADGDYIYVDKTEYIYSLVKSRLKNYYFISRPRRYGKSLMCSTLKCLFEGKRELFEGLYIDKTDYSFEKYPTLHFNFARITNNGSITYDKFLKSFQDAIIREALNNNITVEREEPSDMLLSFLYTSQKNVVIIVDEYDTPIIHTYKNKETVDKIRDTLSSFYSVIKNTNEKIRFFFLTGITKFSNMSIFSEMNNLIDLTFDEDYATALGYTEEELLSNFSDYIDEYMARDDREYETREDFVEAIRDYYDGYRFSYENPVKVYNPVSVGSFFNGKFRFKNYWINTGANTLAMNLAKDYHLGRIITEDPIIGLDTFSTFDYRDLACHTLDDSQILALLYFTGYLTIKEGDDLALTLTFPNKEVRDAFTLSLMKLYSGRKDLSIFLKKGREAVNNGDIPGLVKAMNAYYDKIPYVVLTKEIGYQGMFYSYFLLLGIERIITEETTSLGRIDVVIERGDNVFVIEIKVDQSSDVALNQIREKRYYAGYINRDKAIRIIGINFSSQSRQISEWKEEVVDKTKELTYLGEYF